jgi:deoxyribonuclease IV
VRIGAHVSTSDPLAAAEARQAEVVQLFLSAPQQFKGPKPREDAEQLRTSDVGIYVHAPYLINVATTNNRVRHPSRQLLDKTLAAAADIGGTGRDRARRAPARGGRHRAGVRQLAHHPRAM